MNNFYYVVIITMFLTVNDFFKTSAQTLNFGPILPTLQENKKADTPYPILNSTQCQPCECCLVSNSDFSVFLTTNPHYYFTGIDSMGQDNYVCKWQGSFKAFGTDSPWIDIFHFHYTSPKISYIQFDLDGNFLYTADSVQLFQHLVSPPQIGKSYNYDFEIAPALNSTLAERTIKKLVVCLTNDDPSVHTPNFSTQRTLFVKENYVIPLGHSHITGTFSINGDTLYHYLVIYARQKANESDYLIDFYNVSIFKNYTIDAGNDTTICQGDSLKLGGNPTVWGCNQPYHFYWKTDSLHNPHCFDTVNSNPVVKPTTTTKYYLGVVDNRYKNLRIDSVLITVNDNCQCNYPINFDYNFSKPKISMNANGNSAIIGVYDNNIITFGDNYILKDPNPGLKLFTAKFSDKGIKQWAHSISQLYHPSGYIDGRIYQTNSEITYLVANAFGPLQFENDIQWGSSIDNYCSLNIAAISPTGEVIWTKTFDDFDGNIYSLDQISVNNKLFITGKSDNAALFDNVQISGGNFLLCIDQTTGIVQWVLQDLNWDQHSSKLYITAAQDILFVDAGSLISRVDQNGNILSESVIDSPYDPSVVYSFKYGGGDMFYLFSYIDIVNNSNNFYVVNGLAKSVINDTFAFIPTKCIVGSKTSPSFAPLGNFVVNFYEGSPAGVDFNVIDKYEMLQSSPSSPVWKDKFSVCDYFALDANEEKDYGYYIHYYLYSCGSNCILDKFNISNGDLGCFTGDKQNDVKSFKPVDNAITLSPNPTKGKLLIDMPGVFENVKIELIDPTGRIVFLNKQNIDEKTTIDLSDLKEGFYIIIISYSGKEFFKKVIKQ